MKKINFFVTLFIAMLAFVSCEQRSLKDLIVYEDEEDNKTEEGTDTKVEADGSQEYPYVVTVAEFIEKSVDENVWYELTGEITGAINAMYGNFDLEDSTGKVYVYGLTATPQSKNDNSYESLGLVAGDRIKIRGTRGDYNGKVEVLNAFFVEKVTGDNSGNNSDDNSSVNGSGTQDAPYNVAAAIKKQGEKDKWVEGYIVGVYNFDATDKFVFGADTIKTNVLLADQTGKPSKYIAVQLPSGEIRTALNIVDNPSNLGKKVKVYGSLEKYCGVEGVKSLIKAEIDGKLIDCEVVVSEATPVTIAEFLEKPVDSKVWYELTGVITGTINTDYGNFDLIDETDTVYVYGLTATPQSANDKSYASLGLEAGDKIKIRGTRGEYNGKIEVMNAYFVELVQKQAGEPEPEKPQMEGAEGDGTEATPYNVAAAYNNQGATDSVWVEGYIVGFINRRDNDKPTFVVDGCKEKSNVLIAKEANDTLVYVPVELPSGEIRDALNLQANPINLGKKVKVFGMLEEFFFMPGVKGVSKFVIE